jgi:hypothetical protein
MFFNLKEAADNGVNEGTNWGSHASPAGSMLFAAAPGRPDQYAFFDWPWFYKITSFLMSRSKSENSSIYSHFEA